MLTENVLYINLHTKLAGKVSRSNRLLSQFTLTTETLSRSELNRLWLGLNFYLYKTVRTGEFTRKLEPHN